jgi:hypothetical protein
MVEYNSEHDFREPKLEHIKQTTALTKNAKFNQSVVVVEGPSPSWRCVRNTSPYPLKFFDDFKLKIASKHPFLKQAIHFIF